MFGPSDGWDQLSPDQQKLIEEGEVMGMGSSAGRSKGNRTNGVERATQRQRAHIDPPGFPKADDEPGATWQLTERGRKLRDMALTGVALSFWVMFCCLGAILVASWWGLL